MSQLQREEAKAAAERPGFPGSGDGFDVRPRRTVLSSSPGDF